MKVKVRQGAKTSKLLHEKASPAQKKKSASREGRRASQSGAEVQGQGNAAARRLLRKWLVDESGYEEDTWPLLKHTLQENRSASQRKLFRA